MPYAVQGATRIITRQSSGYPGPTQRIATTHRLKLVQLHIRFVSRLVRTSFPEDFLKPREHGRFVQLIAVELESFYELLHGPFRFERQKRQAERDVPPLTRVIGKMEALTKLLDDILGLFFLYVRVSI